MKSLHSSQLDPFRTDVFYIDRPEVYQEYGFPHHNPSTSDSKPKNSQLTGNLKTTDKSSNLQDKLLEDSSNSKSRINPFETNVFHIEKPTLSQEYGFPNHDPKSSLKSSKDSKSDGQKLGFDVNFSGSSSTLRSVETNKDSLDGNSGHFTDPFKTNIFNIQKPKIPQEYGFPNHDPLQQPSKGRIAPSATEIIFAASSATERSQPRRNVEILREGRSDIPRSEEEKEKNIKS